MFIFLSNSVIVFQQKYICFIGLQCSVEGNQDLDPWFDKKKKKFYKVSVLVLRRWVSFGVRGKTMKLLVLPLQVRFSLKAI